MARLHLVSYVLVAALSVVGCSLDARHGPPTTSVLTSMPQHGGGSAIALAGASAQAHLYAGGFGSPILRFPIIDGLPAPKPDLRIPNTGGPIAVSPLGASESVLYATNGQSIDAFKFGHTRPDRTIALPPTSQGFSWNVVGLAVDRSGYLYVGAVPQPTYAFAQNDRVRVPNAGVLVYDPTASGHAHPIAAISNGSVSAIAIDDAGNLFLCGQDALQAGFCDRYSHVRTHAKLLSAFTGPTLANVPGVTVIGAEVYMSAQDPTNRYDFTAQVFPVTANGKSIQPTREIFATSGSLEGQLAAFAGKLYVEDGHSAGGIWEFDADANGDQPALAEVAVFKYGANGLAIGR